MNVKILIGRFRCGEQEEPLINEIALAGSIPPDIFHFFIEIPCKIRDVSYIGLRIVVIYGVEDWGYWLHVAA